VTYGLGVDFTTLNRHVFTVDRGLWTKIPWDPGFPLPLSFQRSEDRGRNSEINVFALHLVKPGLIEVEYGNILRQQKEDRETGDYDPFITFEADEAQAIIDHARKFVERIENFLNDSNIHL
jgi:hypothetical protein